MQRSKDEDKHPAKWGIPGGKLDNTDGCLVTGLKREVMEEIGIEIENVRLFETHMAVKEDTNKLYLIFTAKTENAPQPLMDTEKVLWISKNKLGTMDEDKFTPNTYKLLTLSFIKKELF